MVFENRPVAVSAYVRGGQSKADCPLAPFNLQCIRTIELIANVICDTFIELSFEVRQLMH